MKEKNINIILGVLVLVFIGALFFYGYDYYNAKTKINETEFYLSDGSICKDVISYNEFKFCNQSTNLVNLYLLEINDPSSQLRVLHAFRNLPDSLNNVETDTGIGMPLVEPETDTFKRKLYLSVNPNFTGSEILLTTGSIGPVMGSGNIKMFNMANKNMQRC